MRLLERTGPVYSREQILEAGLDANPLVSFYLTELETVFPVAQFDVVAGRLEPRIDVADLWAALRVTAMGPLGRWMWIVCGKEELGGVSPLQHLNRRGVDEQLRQLVFSLTPPVLAA